MILTATLRGIEARIVRTTATRQAGLPGLRIEGLGAAAERESRVRVQAALANTDHFLDDQVRVVCDAGGALIDGTTTDLATALAIAVGENASRRPPVKIAAYAELSLAGEVRPVRGVLSALEALKQHADVILVAHENAAEAALVDGVRVVVVRHLASALRYLAGDASAGELVRRGAAAPPTAYLDMRDIAGQGTARRALEIAAAGGHHMLFIGGPGAGKTMCARRLPGILPPLTEGEALEVTRVHSAAGLNIGGGLIVTRPFRAPHHSTTPPGLVGGGAALPRPGEVSLAHRGVLFLDELPEFSRPALEVLAEPLTAGEVVLTRASGTLRFPSRCQLVASTLPCPCGRFGEARCSCSIDSRRRYLARIPERLLSAIDLRVTLAPVDLSAIDTAQNECSAVVAARVVEARARLASKSDARSLALSTRAVTRGEVTSRALHERVLRVAGTIAAIEGVLTIAEHHINEAVTLTGDV